MKVNYPDRFILVDYDDLLEKTKATVRFIFNHCDISWSDQTENFINHSRTKEVGDAYAVFKKREIDDSWKVELDHSIINYIDSYLIKNGLEKFI